MDGLFYLLKMSLFNKTYQNINLFCKFAKYSIPKMRNYLMQFKTAIHSFNGATIEELAQFDDQATCASYGLYKGGENWVQKERDEQNSLPAGVASVDVSGNNFKLYPNPSSGKVFIDYSIDFTDKATIVLNNAMGQQIYVADLLGINHQKELNLFNLKTGIYTYQILQNGRVVKTGKLTLIN